MNEIQITQMEKAVEQGRMSQEQADQAIENIEKLNSPVFIVISAFSGTIGFLIIFFVVALVYYLFAKYLLKGSGNYGSAMVANGLPYYIFLLSSIVVLIYMIATQNLAQTFSVGQLMGIDRSTITGFWLYKLDPFVIWALILTGIGLAKMFQSNDTKKYLFLVFGLWIGWSILTFAISRAVPALSFLGGM